MHLCARTSPDHVASRALRTVHTIREDRNIEELAAFLLEHGISGAPVTGKNGKLVGVVTSTDIVKDRNESGEEARAEGRLRGTEGFENLGELGGLSVKSEGRLVRDIMTPTVYQVSEDTPLAEVARTMVTGRVHRLLVRRGKETVGLIGALDLLKLFYEQPAAVRLEALVTG
jgi:CBS domain-containing protein